ncbi:hypothetical protein BH20ACT5_BH20ACT5_22370 [soil metagenome]
MGSGILLAVLVILWCVVLVPMFLQRNRASESDTGERLVSAMRVLARRPDTDDREFHEVMTGRRTQARDEPRRPYRDEDSLRAQHAEVMARRRRTLLGLIGLAVLWAGLAAFYRSYFWTAQVVLDLIVFAYLVYLRLEVQRETERRERREQRFSERPTPTRAPGRRPVPRASVPLGRPVAATAVDTSLPEGTWAPNPIPAPTYVNKAVAPTRRYDVDDRLIGLDDDDPTFADMAEWQPSRAVGD